MKTKKNFSVCFMIMLLTFISISAIANKTSVKITAVKSADKGTVITVTINVSHNANSIVHYTDWVYLKINGKEVKRWTYDKTRLPVSSSFTLNYKFTLKENVTIEVMGDCNLHGSAGPATAEITLNKKTD